MILVLTVTSYAQKILVVEKIGRGRWFSYKEGDNIRLETKKDKFHFSDQITRITDSSIILGGYSRISLADILYVDKVYKNRKANGRLLIIAGGLSIGISSFNHRLNNQPVIDPVFLSVGVAISSLGLLWYSLAKRKYHIGNKWKLKVLDYSF
ncbi:MAG: hypothetical protein V1733_06650 [bacterium]